MPPQIPTHVSSRARYILIACIIGPIISAIIVGIRVWTRVFITHNLGWDDHAAMITLVFCVGFSVVLGISTQYGMGLHLADMTPEIMTDHNEFIYISSAFYLFSILSYRLALLLMYLRLFGSNTYFRNCTIAVSMFVVGYLSSNIVTLFFGCTPIAKYWQPHRHGHCVNLVKADHAYGSMNVISDVLLFLLPLPMVWQLRLSRKEKWGLVLVFMSGIINCIITTVRFALLVINLHAKDTAWLDAQTFLFTVVEINSGLICGCTPILKPFFRHLFSTTSPTRAQSRRQSEARPISTWMAKYPDDEARWNYMNVVESERGRREEADREEDFAITGHERTARVLQ